MDYRGRGSHARGVYLSTHTVYLAHRNIKSEVRERNRHKNNARVVGNLKERNVGTKGKSLE